MRDEINKDIGSVVESDFNDTPGELNDVSDINISELQYTSPIVEKMKEDSVYSSLCHLVRSIKMADKSDAFLIRMIKDKFKTYCGGLTVNTFRKWLDYYIELRDSYYFGRDVALGELLSIGMNVARINQDTLEGGEYVLKLMDRLDNGTISHKNKPETVDKQAGASNETVKTLGKLVLELTNVDEPPDEDDEDGDKKES